MPRTESSFYEAIFYIFIFSYLLNPYDSQWCKTDWLTSVLCQCHNHLLAAYMLSWYNDHNAQIRLLQTQLTLKSHCCDTTIQCNTNDWFIQKTSRIMVNFTYCHSLNTKPICRDTHNNHCYLVSTHISPSIFVNSTNNKRHIIWCICHNNNIYTV